MRRQKKSTSFVVLLGGLALAALIALAAISNLNGISGAGLRATSRAESTAQQLAVIASLTPATSTPTAEPTAAADRPPTETPRPTREPRPTRTPRPTNTVTNTPEPTVTNTPRPTPRVDPQAQDHYWFDRPIAPPDDNSVALFYPYASTGEGQYPIHSGVEFVNKIGVPVLAAGSGEIVFAGEDGNPVRVGPPGREYDKDGSYYGYAVVIKHDVLYNDKAVFTLYGHLDSVAVAVGDRVAAGAKIGEVGTSGVALGPHLHFEVRITRNSYYDTRNPQLWLKPFAGNGTLIGRVIDENGENVPNTYITVQRPDSEIVGRYEYSYAEGDIVNGDDEWHENFVLGDLPAGEWNVAASVGDRLVIKQIFVIEGQTTWIWLELPSASE